MVLKLAAVREGLVAGGSGGRGTSFTCRVVALLMLALLLAFKLLLLRCEVCLRILIEIEVEGGSLVEVVVGFGKWTAVVLDLLDLVKVLFEGLARVRGIVPPLRLLNDRRDRLVFDDGADVDLVVHGAEDAILIRILHLHVLQQLQPQRLQLVRVVLEEVKVVANSAEDFVEVFGRLALVGLGFHFLLHGACCRTLPTLRR